MKNNGNFIIACCCLFFLLSGISCGTNNFWRQVNRNQKYSQKIYDRYLKEHGNVSMIEPEGNFSVIWYYSDKKIYVTHISRAKISSTEEYDCDSALNIKEIKEYEKKHFLEVLDADIFQSSFYDTETDSLYKIEICLDVTDLKSKGSDSPFLNELREHIIKYKLWDVKQIKVWKEGHWEDVPQDSTVH